MRASLFVSALFAASLIGGAAMADRPGEDGGRSARFNPRERIHDHSARETQARDARQHDTVVRARDPKVTDHLRARGDVIDRSGAHSPTLVNKGSAHSAAFNAKNPLNAKQNAVRNCGPSDDTCGNSGRSATASAISTRNRMDKATSSSGDGSMQRAEIQKMVDARRVKKLNAVLRARFAAAVAGKLGLAPDSGHSDD